MEGPGLTFSDIEQRLRAFEEERYSEFPRDARQADRLAIHEAEKRRKRQRERSFQRSLACCPRISEVKKLASSKSIVTDMRS